MARRTATLLGLAALVAWSTSNALTRDLSGRLGPFALLAFGFGTGGLLLSVLATIRFRGLSWAVGAPMSYLATCGSLLALYLAGYACSLWLAPDDGVALVLGLVNYLWPTFVLLFSLAVFPWQARWGWLGPGIALGLAGIVAAAGGGRSNGLVDALVRTVSDSPAAFALMLGAAVCWGLYTNFARRLGGADGGRVMPLLLLACGALFLVLAIAAGERPDWRASDLPALFVFSTVVCGAGYALWDTAVRAGDLPLLGAAANATPVAATLIAVAWLGEPLTAGVVLGSVLVSAGAVIARRGVVEGGVP